MTTDRHAWAVDLLDPQPGQTLLELGFGPGIVADRVCDRLGDHGLLVGLDRSPGAVSRALRRCAAYVESGRVLLLAGDLRDLPDAVAAQAGAYDAAYSVDVNLFWTGDASPELATLRDLLRPGGRLLVLYGTGPADTDGAARVTGPVAEAVTSAGFEDVRVVTSAAGSGVTAVRSRAQSRPSALRTR